MNTSPDQTFPQDHPSMEPDIQPSTRRWPIRRIVWIIVIALLLFLVYKAVRVGLYGLLAFNTATELRALVRAESSTENLPAFAEPMSEFSRAVTGIEREMRVFSPFLNATAWVPGFGQTVAAIPELLTAGKELINVASDGVSLIAPVMADQGDASPADLIATALGDAEPRVAVWSQRIAVAQQALDRIPADELHPALAERVAQLQSILPLANFGLAIAPELPTMLGADEPRRYLLMVQNNHELRATGGFLTGIGLITVDDGKLASIDFLDSYDITRKDVDHPWAPEPMQQYMGIELMFLRDVNWSPNFPMTAQIAKAMYAQDAGIAVDGVVSIDLRAVELLVDALSPLDVKGADVPITGDNLLEQIKEFWHQPIDTDVTIDSESGDWWEQRKDFMPALATAALGRIKAGNYDYLAVGAAVESALDERAIQAWMDDSDLSAALSEAGWDGALRPEPGADFLSLVDTNMGYNKVDAVLERSLHYDVTWPDGDDQPGLATATINYLHPVSVPDHVCNLTPRYDSPEYDDMTRRCYFDYVRLYVPEGSELVSIEGVDPESISSQRGEQGTEVLAGYFQLLPGYQHNLVFTYRLPPLITPDNYALVVQRQSGSKPLPVTATVASHTLDTIVSQDRLIWAPNQ